MTTARKEQIIRRKFKTRKCVSKVSFIYSTIVSAIEVTVRYKTSGEYESAREHVQAVADELGSDITDITFEKSTKNYEYTIFHLNYN